MANNRYSGPFRNYYESNKFYTVGGSASGEIVPIPGPIKLLLHVQNVTVLVYGTVLVMVGKKNRTVFKTVVLSVNV